MADFGLVSNFFYCFSLKCVWNECRLLDEDQKDDSIALRMEKNVKEEA